MRSGLVTVLLLAACAAWAPVVAQEGVPGAGGGGPAEGDSVPAPDTSGLTPTPAPAATDSVAVPGVAAPESLVVTPPAAPTDSLRPGVPPGAPGAPPAQPAGGAAAPAAADTSADALFQRLAGESPPGQTVYRGERLTLFPEEQVIVLSGQAQAEQDSTVATANRIAYVRDENILQAFGAATVKRGASSLQADTLFYDQGEGIVTTFGPSTLTEGGQTVTGADLRYGMDSQSGALATGRTEYDRWYLRGEDMHKIGERTFVVDEGTFTTDPADVPDYHFSAEDIKLRQEDVIVARPVVLYVSDVPIFFLPFYLEPLGQGRKSGLLRPKIGLNTLINASGEERNVQDLGFYWAISQYMDAQAALDWFSESRTILRFDYRYALRYLLNGSLHYEQVWNRQIKSKDTLLRVSHDHDFDPSTQLRIDGNIATSRSFFEENSFDPERLLQRALRSNASFNRRFTWGNLSVGASSDFRLQEDRTDFKIPQLNLTMNTRPLFPGGRLDADWRRNLTVGANTSLDWSYTTQGDSLGGPDSVLVNTQTSVTRATLSGPFDILGFINVTPSLSASEVLFANRALPDSLEALEEPSFGHLETISSALSLAGTVFRVFQGGPGPVTKVRHTFSPSVSFNYAPATRPREELPLGFPGGGGVTSMNAAVTLTNHLDLKVRETKETARRRQEEEERMRRAREAGLLRPRGELTLEEQLRLDSLAVVDSLAELQEEAEEDSVDAIEELGQRGVEEVRQPGALEAEEPEEVVQPPEDFTERTVRLLTMTNRMGYDFERASDPRLLGVSTLTTDISSNVSQAVSFGVSLQHNLVNAKPRDDGNGIEEVFEPFLSSVNTVMRFGGGSARGFRESTLIPEEDRREEEVTDAEAGQGGFSDGVGLGDEPPGFETIQSSSLGRWDVDLTHSLSRAREQPTRQSIRFGTSFSPTENWSLRYRTGFDITESRFQDQTVSLVRNLNRWQATLNLSVFPQEPQDRVLVEFAVYLRDIPDLRIPYRVRRE